MDVAPEILPRLAHTRLEIGADAEATHRQRQVLAALDFRRAADLWRLSATLAWLDIKLKYRGSLLGPFWLTISTGVMVAAMGGIYGSLFHMDLKTYLPFLALSLVLWNALSALVIDACATFTQSEGLIRSIRMPFFLHALRVLIRNMLTFAHNVPVVVVVFLIYAVSPGMNGFRAAPGFVLWLIDATAACMLLGSFCARFRDIPPIVGSIIQIAFFVTPIVWRPDQLGPRGWWLPLNPFDSLLDIVRTPLLGAVPSAEVWLLALGYSAAFCATAWVLFARVRGRLAYWM